MKPILQIFNTRFVSLYTLWQETKLLTGNVSICQQITHLFISILRKCSEMILSIMHIFLKQLNLIQNLSDKGPKKSFNLIPLFCRK